MANQYKKHDENTLEVSETRVVKTLRSLDDLKLQRERLVRQLAKIDEMINNAVALGVSERAKAERDEDKK